MIHPRLLFAPRPDVDGEMCRQIFHGVLITSRRVQVVYGISQPVINADGRRRVVEYGRDVAREFGGIVLRRALLRRSALRGIFLLHSISFQSSEGEGVGLTEG